jgi:hypothetical protein
MIGASDAQTKALKAAGTEFDLFDRITNQRPFKVPSHWPPARGPLKVVVVTNFELLLGDPEQRRAALGALERLAAEQGDSRDPRYLIAILASLSPLDRLLQSIEREREESKGFTKEQEITVRRERIKYREDMRWSALLEEFTTFYRAASPRSLPSGETLENKPNVETVWRELEYLPDHAVAAVIGYLQKPLEPKEVFAWAEKLANSVTEPRAIIDYLASNLIEHYHLVWSLSGRAERLLLYEFAHRKFPHLARAYSLRSLIRRGLVVLDPYPRVVNESFAQFICHVEKSTTIQRWRATQEAGLWRVVRVAVGLALPLTLGVLLFALINSGESLSTVLPLLLAAGPVLINLFGAGDQPYSGSVFPFVGGRAEPAGR